MAHAITVAMLAVHLHILDMPTTSVGMVFVP